jgi:hypothetical protein
MSEKKRGGYRVNAKRPTISDKPKVQMSARVDANLLEKWEQTFPKIEGKKAVGVLGRTDHLEKAMRQYLEWFLLPDELYPSVFDEV